MKNSVTPSSNVPVVSLFATCFISICMGESPTFTSVLNEAIFPISVSIPVPITTHRARHIATVVPMKARFVRSPNSTDSVMR